MSLGALAAATLFWAVLAPLIFILLLRAAGLDCDLRVVVTRCERRAFWKGRVVWVVDDSTPLGRSLVGALVRRGAFVIIGGLRGEPRPKPWPELAERSHAGAVLLLNDAVQARGADGSAAPPGSGKPLTSQSACPTAAAVEAAVAWRGRLDVVFDNSHEPCSTLFAPVDEEICVVQRNYMNRLRFIKLLLPAFFKQKMGHVLNFTDIATRLALPGRAADSAATHALLAHSHATELELRAVRIPGIFISTVLIGKTSDSLAPRTMSVTRCTKLLLGIASHGLGSELWLAPPAELTFLYLSYYLPNLWRFVASLLAADILARNSPQRKNATSSMPEKASSLQDVATHFGYSR